MPSREGKSAALTEREQELWVAAYRRGWIAHSEKVASDAHEDLVRAGGRVLQIEAPLRWPLPRKGRAA